MSCRSNKPSVRPFPRSDAGNAELFCELYGDELRYDHRRGIWHLWADHHWREDSDGEVYRRAVTAARRRFADAAAITDLDERGREAKFAITSENRQRLEAMLHLAARRLPIATSGEGWDADSQLLAVANGVLHLEAGRLHSGRPTEMISMASPVAYEPAAKCLRWERFLAEVFAGDDELVDWFWRLAGYLLSGETSEQCFFLLYGLGANGKSTLMNVLCALLGDYAYNAPFATFEAASRSDPQRFGGPPRAAPRDELRDEREHAPKRGATQDAQRR